MAETMTYIQHKAGKKKITGRTGKVIKKYGRTWDRHEILKKIMGGYGPQNIGSCWSLIPGPFTSDNRVYEYMELCPESKEKNERMYCEVGFHRWRLIARKIPNLQTIDYGHKKLSRQNKD